MEYPYLYEGTGRPGDFSVYIVGSKDDLPDTYNYRHVYVTDINQNDLRHRTMFNMGIDGHWNSYLILGSNITRYFKEVERIVDEATEAGFTDVQTIIRKRHEVAELFVVRVLEAEPVEVTPVISMPTEEVEVPFVPTQDEQTREEMLQEAMKAYPFLANSDNELLEWSNKYALVVGAQAVTDIHTIAKQFATPEFISAIRPYAPEVKVKIVEKDPYADLTTTQHLCRLVDRLVLETEALGRTMVKETEADFKIAMQRKIEDKISELNKIIDLLDESFEHTYYKYKHVKNLVRTHDGKEFFIIDPWHRNFNMHTGQFQHALRERNKSQLVNFYVDREKLAQDFEIQE